VTRAVRVGAAVAVALGATAAPAHASGFTLSLATQSDAVVGRPLMIQATGTIPPEDIQFPYWFSLVAIPPAVTTTCPPDHFEGMQFASANGGAILSFEQGERPDSAGNFTVPVAVTPSAPGSVLLCAYTDDGAASTLTGASLMVDIAPAAASPPPAGGSRPPSPPAYARQGVRSCRALMTGANARSCVRDILRKADARCRRLSSRRARAHCLHAVRRAAR
jgi:hypothetical protein